MKQTNKSVEDIIQKAIQEAGFKNVLPVQRQTIEVSQKKNELVLLSKTGSGKTLAFLLSLLTKLNSETQGIQALILSPSRELSLQIETVFKSLKTGFTATACYGGHSVKTEINNLNANPAVVIGTPGRIADHLRRSHMNLDKCMMIVIDEFDKCLEFGFDKEMEEVQSYLKSEVSKILVSATKSEFYPEYLQFKNPEIIDNLENEEKLKVDYFLAKYSGDRYLALSRLISTFENEKSIVFCNYREVAENVSQEIESIGVPNSFYHGGLEQEDRERALIKFRNDTVNTLICTDLGARGLDIPEVRHIIHYQLPSSEEALIHRNGRTARMASSGKIYYFTNEENQLPQYVTKPENDIDIDSINFKEIVPYWNTLWFGEGKKDKLNKIDIVGFLHQQFELEKNEIGLIQVLDHSAYVAVSANVVSKILKSGNINRIKGRKVKIRISK